MNKQATPILFLDFDGTISRRDAIDAILERFADERWKIIEEAWKNGAIGSRQCLREQVSLITAAPNEINALLDEIQLDEGFGELLETCRRRDIQAYIVSDGFDYCIERILSRLPLLKGPPVFSSRLEFRGGIWRADFPHFAESCEHNCATCKPQVMKILNPYQAPMVFVGDGLSDRYAAQTADLVFAKKSLAKYCAAENVEFNAYENLHEVAVRLAELISEIMTTVHRPALTLSSAVELQKVFN